MQTTTPAAGRDAGLDSEFKRGLGLYDATMVVVGSMIGSGIFIVSADMARLIGSPGWLLMAWLLTGVLTVGAALAYGELAAMMPRAGGQYVFLREAFSPLWGFLYGWTLFTVIQTGTIAAVAVAFARFTGVLVPAVAEDQYLIAPIHITSGYAVSLSTAQLLGVLLIALLTWSNTRGLEYGKIIQNVFTTAKTGALVLLIAAGLLLGWNAEAVSANFGDLWTPRGNVELAPGLTAATAFGLFVAIGIAQTGSLFSSDAWNNICFTAGEVKDPRRTLPLAMVLGTGIVTGLYVLSNIAYLVSLPLAAIQTAPSDRVATLLLNNVFPGFGAGVMAAAIMVSTFGCVNGLVLAGARAYYAMARDGLFFKRAGELNAEQVPAFGLVLQGLWAVMLVLPRTYDATTGRYGNLYGNLLDYVISAALIFYALTVAGLFRLRVTRPDAPRPYKAFGYPVIPALYIAGAAAILFVLFAYRPATTWPGLAIVLAGVPVYLVARGDARVSWTPDRDAALALLHEYTKGESLRRHAYAVEAAVVGYARRFGEDEALWSVTALLHDFDYEQWPSLDVHPYKGVEILKGHGYPEIVTRAILSHADYSGVTRDSLLEKSLYACDEMSGFVTAAALVRPSKSVMDLEAPSVKKRMKDKAFAKAVSREDLQRGADELGLPLETHIANVIESLRERADDLGLRGGS